jgi:competence protein ComFC
MVGVDIIIPVPPTRARAAQPVLVLAEGISKGLNLSYAPACVTRTRDVPELKNVYDYDERIRLLSGAHAVDRQRVAGRRVLLFDDLYRSGATMNAITAALYEDGSAKDVFALALTRTRSNQ